MTQAELLVPPLGTLRESWSGLALQRSGRVTPLVVPALDANGRANVASDQAGAIRLWLTPYWSSVSLSDSAGPGAEPPWSNWWWRTGVRPS